MSMTQQPNVNKKHHGIVFLFPRPSLTADALMIGPSAIVGAVGDAISGVGKGVGDSITAVSRGIGDATKSVWLCRFTVLLYPSHIRRS